MSSKSIKSVYIFWALGLICVILIIALPFGFFYVLNNGNPYTKYLTNKYVPKHLQDLGYTTTDFKEAHFVEPNYLINKEIFQGHYMVIFKDEPDTTYYYGITKWGKHVKQFCEKDRLSSDGVTDIVNTKTKHSESECVNSLDKR